MKLNVIVLVCLSASACVDPPVPIQEVTRSISIDANGCPTDTTPMAVNRNDKASWSLNSASEGYPGTTAYAVTFLDYNPSYCVNQTTAPPDQNVSCTIRVNAKAAPVCYDITIFRGAETRCQARFSLQVDGALPRDCADSERAN